MTQDLGPEHELEEKANYLNYVIQVLEEEYGRERGASGLSVYAHNGQLYITDGVTGEPLEEYEQTIDGLRSIVRELIQLWEDQEKGPTKKAMSSFKTARPSQRTMSTGSVGQRAYSHLAVPKNSLRLFGKLRKPFSTRRKRRWDK